MSLTRLRPCASRPFSFKTFEHAVGYPPIEDVAGLLGIREDDVRSLRQRWLTSVEADRFAVIVGCHPVEIWGELWWDEAVKEEARQRRARRRSA